MGDDITRAIEGLTRRVHAYRVFESFKRGELTMPPLIEIKGLGASVGAAKRMIAEAKAETAGLTTDVGKLVTAVKDVRVQVNQHFDDLKFEAETLGNGGESIAEEPEPAPAVVGNQRAFDRMG